ncbi:uncharacterized protein BDR25DRAFT_203445, partial [Lindgomyces ingoldianus]
EHEGWQRGQVASTNSWRWYQDAYPSKLRMWCASENDLTAWHAIHRAIGIKP